MTVCDDLKLFKDGEVIKVKNGNVEVSLNSNYNADDFNIKKAKRMGVESSKLIFLLGFGSGHMYEAIISLSQSDADIVVIEPYESMFNYVVTERNLFDKIEDKRVHFIFSNDLLQIVKSIEKYISAAFFKNPVIIESAGYKVLFPEFIDDTYKAIEQAIEIEKSILMTKKMGERFFNRNILKNMRYMINRADISELFDLFKGHSAVIVSAGPSLGKQIENLKKAKNKVIIICVDTTLRVLLNNQIVPDLVVSIDFTPVNYKHFNGIDTSNINFAFASIVYPECIKHHVDRNGDFFTIYNDGPLMDKISKYIAIKGEVAVGDSTSHAAFHIAEKMGCSHIALIGQDLSYDNGKTHADGVATQRKDIKDDLIEVDGYYGGKIKTSSSLLTILKHFENKIAQSSSKIFNCTEGGAKVNGAINMNFIDFINKYSINDYDYFSVIKQKLDKKNLFLKNKFICDFKFESKRLLRIRKLSINALRKIKKVIDYLCNENIDDLISESKNIDEIYYDVTRDNEILTILESDIDISLNRLRWEEYKIHNNYKFGLLKDIEKDSNFFSNLYISIVNYTRETNRLISYLKSVDLKEEELTDFILRKITERGLK